MSSEILRIIEGGLSNDKSKIINYSMRLAERLKSEGDTQLARCIFEQIECASKKNSATADAVRMLPLDNDSKMQIVEIIPEDSCRTKIVLGDNVEQLIDEFIDIVNHGDDLEMAGLSVPKTLLLYGDPGCGKTSLAHYISERTNLPLVVARLDGLVSSLLGNTSKNIRKIFDYANSLPCILFLDEFDAIAKARDDNHELGELKRVINSLLQNIDNMSPDSVLLAATNHPNLLDKAVWRRFITKVEVGMPDFESRKKILDIQTEGFNTDYSDDLTRQNTLTELMTNMSPSDIATLFSKLKIKSVIKGTRQIDYEDVLVAVFEFENTAPTMDDRIRFLSQNGVTQANISKKFNVSMRQVRNVLQDK